MSHFSFTRSSYDRCALEKKDEESSAPFKWMTDVNVSESKDVCFESTSPFMQNPFKSIPSSVVDIESDLKGHKFDISKCPTHKYNPEQSEKIDFKLNECKENRLVPEYSRTKRPCNILSGVYIDRFQPFNEDYKNIVHDNSYIGVNTRLKVKDTFKEKKSNEYKNPSNFKFDLKSHCSVNNFGCVNLKQQNL